MITFRTSGAQLAQQYRTHKIAIYDDQNAGKPPRDAAGGQLACSSTTWPPKRESHSATRTALRPKSTCSRRSAPAWA